MLSDCCWMKVQWSTSVQVLEFRIILRPGKESATFSQPFWRFLHSKKRNLYLVKWKENFTISLFLFESFLVHLATFFSYESQLKKSFANSFLRTSCTLPPGVSLQKLLNLPVFLSPVSWQALVVSNLLDIVQILLEEEDHILFIYVVAPYAFSTCVLPSAEEDNQTKLNCQSCTSLSIRSMLVKLYITGSVWPPSFLDSWKRWKRQNLVHALHVLQIFIEIWSSQTLEQPTTRKYHFQMELYNKEAREWWKSALQVGQTYNC